MLPEAVVVVVETAVVVKDSVVVKVVPETIVTVVGTA